MKPLEFLGTSQDDLKNFPAEARRVAGFELHFVQQGLMPADWKPMPQVGQGAMEIRIQCAGRMASRLRRQICRRLICPARIPEENAENSSGRY